MGSRGYFLGRFWVDAELGCWTGEEAVFLPSNSGRQRGRRATHWDCSREVPEGRLAKAQAQALRGGDGGRLR